MTPPLVSVIICTLPSRIALLNSLALPSYKSQTYPYTELIVVGDTDKNLATKRNIGIQLARGTYIIHFDDDDWSSQERIWDQFHTLEDNSWAVLTGYRSSMWWHRDACFASFYNGPTAWGATICYKRSFALAHPWEESTDSNEDNEFISIARFHGVIENADAAMFVATQGNLSNQRDLTKPPFTPCEASALPREFRKAMGIQL